MDLDVVLFLSINEVMLLFWNAKYVIFDSWWGKINVVNSLSLPLVKLFTNIMFKIRV